MKKLMMKQKLLILAAAALLLFTGCGKSSSKDITVDTAALAKELNESAVTSDTLTQTQSTMFSQIYFVDEDALAGGAAYMSSGATACEVAVIECKSADQTGDVEKLFQQRVDNQSSLYASYNAGEVDKLENAIIKSAGKYVVLCVCDDTEAAETILKNYGF